MTDSDGNVVIGLGAPGSVDWHRSVRESIQNSGTLADKVILVTPDRAIGDLSFGDIDILDFDEIKPKPDSGYAFSRIKSRNIPPKKLNK